LHRRGILGSRFCKEPLDLASVDAKLLVQFHVLLGLLVGIDLAKGIALLGRGVDDPSTEGDRASDVVEIGIPDRSEHPSVLLADPGRLKLLHEVAL